VDGDCLDDTLEPGLGTLTVGPTAQDFDSDGVIDGVEVANGGNPLATGSADDGVSDYTEIFQFTNPALADTDGDGSNDLQDCPLQLWPVAGQCTVANGRHGGRRQLPRRREPDPGQLRLAAGLDEHPERQRCYHGDHGGPACHDHHRRVQRSDR
jgi:hypothetical protein